MAVEILVTSEGKLNCHECDDKLKEERGHDKDGIVPFWVNEEMVFRCPLTFITPFSWEMIKAFSFYEKAILPNGKGWIEESNKFIQSMMVLDNAFNSFRNKEINNASNRTRNTYKGR